jgi:hypothetical protein
MDRRTSKRRAVGLLIVLVSIFTLAAMWNSEW